MPTDPETIATAKLYPGWIVLALTMLMAMLAAGPVYYAYGNYALAFAAEYGASRTTINFAYTMVLLLGNLGSAPVGWLLDRWPVRRVAMIGVVGTGAGLALVGMTSSMMQVLILFSTLIALADICLGVVVTNFLLSHWFERRRGLAIAFSQLGTSAGAILFPPLTTALTLALGWRAVFLLYGTAILVIAVPLWVFAKVPSAMPAVEAVARPAGHVPDPSISVLTMSRHPSFWIVTFAIGAMIGINGGTMISLAPFTASIGQGPAAGALLVSIAGGGALAGKFGFGIVADRVNLPWVLRAALLLLATGHMILAAGGAVVPLELGALCCGLALGGMMPVWGLVTARIFGLASYGRALGGTRAAMTPLAFFCPMLAGALFDLDGSYRWVWTSYAMLALIAFAITFTRRRWAEPLALQRQRRGNAG